MDEFCVSNIMRTKSLLHIFQRSRGMSGYPLYHSAYDTFSIAQIVDPDFKHLRAVGQILGEMIRRLSDEYVLPLDARGYAKVIQGLVNQVEQHYGPQIRARAMSMGKEGLVTLEYAYTVHAL